MDTKTKIRMRQRDLDRVNALKLDPTIEDHLIEQLGEPPKNRSRPAAAPHPAPPSRSKSVVQLHDANDDGWDDVEEADDEETTDTKGMIVIKPEMWVSKYFEAKERDHESNSKMYPTNVKSKLPNQKIISSIRPVTANPSGRFVQLARSKSSMMSKSVKLATPQAPLVPILFNRPKTPGVKARPKTAVDTSRQPENKLMTGSQLNLMTHSEVDDLVNSIVQSKTHKNDYEKEKEERNKEMYKRLWLLKSKGEYHGSLLAQTRSLAPEIRE